ncbi:MAG: hypothetical protein DRQ42_07470 [Gammaproteobacteria bacterium]|nr:MAG: hypothetical protein DRQ42_07470 [Gammaproteobacteria bacterium]
MATFEELMAIKQAQEQPETPAMSFDDLMAVKAEKETKKESFSELIAPPLIDAGRAMGRGLAGAGEFALDVMALPQSMAERVGNVIDAPEGQGFDAFWEPTEIGKRTAKATRLPDSMYESMADIDETNFPKSSEVYDASMKGVEIATGDAALAPLAGLKHTASGLKAAIGAGAGGATSDYYLDDATYGSIAGALAGDPKALVELAKSTGRGAANIGNYFVDYFKKNPNIDNADLKHLRAGLQEISRQAYNKDSGEMSLEYVEGLMTKVREAVKEGKTGTIGQLTGDRGILNWEARGGDIEGIGRGFTRELDKINAKLKTNVTDATDAISPTGVTANAADAPRETIAKMEDQAVLQGEKLGRETVENVQPRLEKALEANKQSNAPFADRVDTGVDSVALKQTVTQAKDDAFEAMQAEWAKLPNKGTTSKVSVKTAVDGFLNKIKTGGESIPAQLKKEFPDTFKQLDSLGNDVTLEELSNLLSKLSSEANMIQSGNRTGSMLKHVEGLKEAIYSSLDDVAGGSATQRKKAASMYKDYMETYGAKTKLGKSLDVNDAGFGSERISAGDKGLDKFRETLDASPNSREAAGNYMKSLYQQEVMVDGVVNPTKHKEFLKNYGGHLDEIPTVRDEINHLASSSTELGTATKNMTVAEKQAAKLREQGVKTADAARKDTSIGQFGSTPKDEVEVIQAARNIMTPEDGKDRLKELTELVNNVKRSGRQSPDDIHSAFREGLPNTPSKEGRGSQSFDDLRSAFRDDMTNTLSKDGKLTQDGLKKFRQDRSVYEKSGLFTKAELDRIEDGMVEAQKMYLHNAESLSKLTRSKQTVAETVAALAGAKAGALLFGSPLIGASIGRRFVVNQMNKLTDDKARKLAYEMTVDPEKFVKVLDRLSEANIGEKAANDAITELFKLGSIGVAQEERRDNYSNKEQR